MKKFTIFAIIGYSIILLTNLYNLYFNIPESYIQLLYVFGQICILVFFIGLFSKQKS
jgi:Mg2+ and Co2+ transporter CorA